jgi:hypothetical protein
MAGARVVGAFWIAGTLHNRLGNGNGDTCAPGAQITCFQGKVSVPPTTLIRI